MPRCCVIYTFASVFSLSNFSGCTYVHICGFPQRIIVFYNGHQSARTLASRLAKPDSANFGFVLAWPTIFMVMELNTSLPATGVVMRVDPTCYVGSLVVFEFGLVIKQVFANFVFYFVSVCCLGRAK